MTRLHGRVKHAHGAHAQDVLPAVVLLKDVEHLVLSHHLAQHGGVLWRRYAQQQAIIVRLEAKEV